MHPIRLLANNLHIVFEEYLLNPDSFFKQNPIRVNEHGSFSATIEIKDQTFFLVGSGYGSEPSELYFQFILEVGILTQFRVAYGEQSIPEMPLETLKQIIKTDEYAAATYATPVQSRLAFETMAQVIAGFAASYAEDIYKDPDSYGLLPDDDMSLSLVYGFITSEPEQKVYIAHIGEGAAYLATPDVETPGKFGIVPNPYNEGNYMTSKHDVENDGQWVEHLWLKPGRKGNIINARKQLHAKMKAFRATRLIGARKSNEANPKLDSFEIWNEKNMPFSAYFGHTFYETKFFDKESRLIRSDIDLHEWDVNYQNRDNFLVILPSRHKLCPKNVIRFNLVRPAKTCQH